MIKMIVIASKLTEQKMKKSLIENFIFCAVTVCKYYVKPWVNSSGLYFSTAFAFKKTGPEFDPRYNPDFFWE